MYASWVLGWALELYDGGMEAPVGRPAPVVAPSVATGTQGHQYDLDCTNQHTKHC